MSLCGRCRSPRRCFAPRKLHSPAGVLLALVLSAPAAGQPPGKPAFRTDVYGDPLPERAVCRLGTTRLLHGGFVTATAFSGDGRRFASASIDGSVVVWEWPS